MAYAIDPSRTTDLGWSQAAAATRVDALPNNTTKEDVVDCVFVDPKGTVHRVNPGLFKAIQESHAEFTSRVKGERQDALKYFVQTLDLELENLELKDRCRRLKRHLKRRIGRIRELQHIIDSSIANLDTNQK